MKMKRLLGAGIVVMAVFALSATALCELKNWTKIYQGPKKDVVTLLITGNYAKSRLLTDLIQSKNNQPYILVPQKPGDKFYFVPAGKNEGLVLDDEKFTKFIKFINPANIIIIGDTRYVPEYYIGRIDSTQTCIRINNKSWFDIAAGAGEILDLPGLAKDYKKLYEELESGKLYSKYGKNAPDIIVEETVVEEVAPPAPAEPAPAEPVIIKEDEPPLK